MKFDGLKMVDDLFGGPRPAAALVARYGQEAPTEANLQKWLQRGVPAIWTLRLAVYAELERGAPVPLSAYIEP